MVVDEAARREWQTLEMPAVTYLDGFNVPNYENRRSAPKFQLPFTAEDAQRFMQTPAEFEVQLFAQEPDIIKPITMSRSTNAAGSGSSRRWTIRTKCSNGNPGDDRIKILEDTNGDGRADKVTVFAEHLNLPTSLTFANGGVIVAAAPHLLFLKDTNGDDKADVRQMLNTGWGIRDTHAGPSNLQYAPDNHIWGAVGYSGFDGTDERQADAVHAGAVSLQAGRQRVRVPDDVDEQHVGAWVLGERSTCSGRQRTTIRAGSWRSPTDISPTSRGCRAAARRRCGGPRRRRISERSSVLPVHPTTPYIRQVDVWGGYTAAAGHYLYTARVVPEGVLGSHRLDQRADGALIGQAVIESDGAGFVARDGWNLISSAEEWFAPVASMVGPDGAVWMADWYNFIAQHNPTPAGIQRRQGRGLRDVDARSPARPHLPDRLQGRAAGQEAIAVEERIRRAC